VISCFVSLTLSPALCAVLLKPHKMGDAHDKPVGLARLLHPIFSRFNAAFEWLSSSYGGITGRFVRATVVIALVYVGLISLTGFQFSKMSTGFIPEQDTSLGPYMLAPALRLHWCCAYLFMLNGVVYLVGILLGGEWRALLPRLSDAHGAVKMAAWYAGTPLAILHRQPRKLPRQSTKYNPLQRLAYFSIPVAGFLSVLTGWAIHKPMQFSWLAAIFGGFESARVWHFWLMWIFVLFVIPHVILIFSDGWDTLRSMITGWSGNENGGQTNEA